MSNAWNWYPLPPEWAEFPSRLKQTEDLVQKLNDQLKSIHKQLDDLKAKPPLHVEYHFDQLKVNRLEGTLNVGLTPQAVGDIGSFEVPAPTGSFGKDGLAAQEPPTPDAMPIEPPIAALQQQMADYMDRTAPDVLASLDQAAGSLLDPTQHRKVIEDVKRQVGERVHYYARTTSYPSQGDVKERQKWADDVKEKTYRDIQSAFAAYLGKLQANEQIYTNSESGS
jgi:spore germination protein PC